MADQPSQESTLQAVLEQLKTSNAGDEEIKNETQEVVKAVRKQRSDVGKHHNWNKKNAAGQNSVFKGLLGHFSWAKKFQERAAKAAKVAASKAVDFGKAKIKAVSDFAGNILDLLMKGLGLAALWALFDWLSTADLESTVEKVKEWYGKIKEEWTTVTDILDGIFVVLTRIGSGLWLFKAVMNLIKGWFGFMGPVGTLWKFLLGLGFRSMFLAGGAIRGVMSWIAAAFGLDGTIAKSLKAIKESATFTKWFGPQSKIQSWITWIKGIFGAEGSIAKNLSVIKGNIAGKFTAWMGGDSSIAKFFRWIGSFFGSADEGGKIMKALQTIKSNKVIVGIQKFLGSIGAKMLKFFGPIGWIMAAYDAVVAFMAAFESEEGSLWDKTVAGLSAGIKAIVDFFVFDLIKLAEDSIKWLIKKVMGLFGMDEKEIEGKDFMKFSVTGFLKEVFGDIMKIFEGVLKLDPALALEGLKGLFGKSADIFGWLFDIAIKPAINWIGKNIFGMKDDAISADFDLAKWLKEDVLDPLFNWIEGLFNIDFGALAKKIMPSALYNFLFGSSGDEASEKAFEKGAFIDDAGMNSVDETKLKAMLAEGSESDQKKLMSGLVAAYQDNTGNLEDVEREKLKNLLNEYGASLNRGGFIPAGKTVPAVLHGPELVKPLPDMEKEGGMGSSGAPMIINAPTTSNVSSGSTTMAVASSSINPMHNKYFLNG